ncbi:MAG TPA: glycine betaine ABC transporter substrate-binding protein [Pseudonocardia sp.]|nr:glycine betaine ABC transporter substrate-binding protein [Pseudonocardia sp.]
MRRARTRTGRLAAVLAAAALAITACGGGGGGEAVGGGGGSLAAVDLGGASFTVGSKEFTEQIILGEIAVQALEEAGADVQTLATITGSTNVRTALTAGELDMYWEYTGTGWSTHLQREVTEAPRDEKELYDQVKQADAANGIAWLDPAPLNNAYAIAISRAKGEELGVATLSDYANLVNTNPAQARMCAAAEFLTRDDGLPGVARTYGFELPGDGVAELELSLIPPETSKAEACTVGEVTVTDGAVSANDLVVLEDDKSAFVDYNVAMTVRQEVLDANPGLADVFNPIAAKLTSDAMRTLNERVDIGGELPDEVAGQWLQENGFTG